MTWHTVPGKHAAFAMGHLPPAALEGVKHVQTMLRGQPVTIVKHDQQSYELMRSRGMVLPAPSVHYEYPGRFKPMAHQRATVDFFVQHHKCFCLNGLGTGKSLAATWATDYMMQQGAVRRAVIVAPLSIVEHVWERELFQTLPHRSVAVVKGSAARKRQIAADTRFDILIINPESLEIVMDHLPMVDLVVVDEFTKFKNARSNRWKALRKITQSTRLWMMSGTPAPQSPLDAYGPMKLVLDRVPSFGQWKDMTMQQVSKFRWVPRENAEHIIAKHLQPAVRYKREDCYDMPDVQEIFLDVDLTSQQTKLIERFRKEAAAEIAEHQVTAANAAAVLSKVLQVMAGGVYGQDEDGDQVTHFVDAAPLFEAVEEIVEQADTPVLVFAPFRSAVTAIHQYLEKAGYRVGKITGDVPAHERTPLFDAVQHNQLDALVAVAGTMSHGLTLTTSRYVLWALPPFAYEEYEQANGRVIRNWQENDVVIYHLVQNKLAKELFERLKSKARLQDAVLNLITGGV